MGKHALSTGSAIKLIGENFTKMNILENLIQGNLAIHQELINKFLKETLEGNKTFEAVEVFITGGYMNLRAEIRAGEKAVISVGLMVSLGNFEFNRFKRFVELIVNGPVTLTIHGITITARLGVELDPDPLKRNGTPESLVSLLHFLRIKEDKIVVDFNKIPGFNQALQKKVGFLLKNLEITKLELVEEMLIIHPTIKFF